MWPDRKHKRKAEGCRLKEEVKRLRLKKVEVKNFLNLNLSLLLTLTLALALTLSTGCGYRFLGRSISDTQSRKIAIPTFHNDTFEPLIGKKVTGFIKEEIVSNGGLQLINDPSLADLTLTGRITSFSLAPISSSNNRATEYRVSIRIDVGLTGKNNKPGLTDRANIWTEKGREVTAEYFVTDDIAANSTAENRAIEEAAKLFAEDLVSRILEGL